MAEPAAMSAECADVHGRFWEMHDGIYENQDQLSVPLLFTLADALGISQEELRDALTNAEYESKVKADFMGGARSGVNGTPTFFINGERHEGLLEFDDFVAAIEARLETVNS